MIQAGTWNIFPSVRCAAEVPLSSRPWESNRTSLNPRQPQNYFWYQSGGTEIERGGYIFSGTFITDPGGSVIPAALSHVGCLSVDFGSSGPFLGMSCFNNSSAFVSRFWKPVWKYRNVCVWGSGPDAVCLEVNCLPDRTGLIFKDEGAAELWRRRTHTEMEERASRSTFKCCFGSTSKQS